MHLSRGVLLALHERRHAAPEIRAGQIDPYPLGALPRSPGAIPADRTTIERHAHLNLVTGIPGGTQRREKPRERTTSKQDHNNHADYAKRPSRRNSGGCSECWLRRIRIWELLTRLMLEQRAPAGTTRLAVVAVACAAWTRPGHRNNSIPL